MEYNDRFHRIYICIDLKSYYASVECVYRGLDPLTTNLLVADESRSDKTICLAVSPSLKAIGVPGRPRLFEAKQKIREYEWKHRTEVEFIIVLTDIVQTSRQVQPARFCYAEKEGETMAFDYFYGNESMQFAFYRIPKTLMLDPPV